MKTYSVNLDLTIYERGVLIELLANDARRSVREQTTGTPWNRAVLKISAQIHGHSSPAITAGMSEAERFFYDNAGSSYDPKTQTEHQGRAEGARKLAAAEARLKAGSYFVGHTPDDMPWDGDVPYDGPLWVVTLYAVDGATDSRPLGSIGGVACEESDDYMRVIAAELASEYLPADQ